MASMEATYNSSDEEVIPVVKKRAKAGASHSRRKPRLMTRIVHRVGEVTLQSLVFELGAPSARDGRAR